MGLCLSCLRPDVEEQGYDERTSLLNDSRFADEEYQNELLRQQKRQNELSNIVNDLNENLIDVSTFFTSNEGPVNDGAQVTDGYVAEDGFEQPSPALTSAGLESREKQYPKIWTLEEKAQLLERVSRENIKCELKAPQEALYVDL